MSLLLTTFNVATFNILVVSTLWSMLVLVLVLRHCCSGQNATMLPCTWRQSKLLLCFLTMVNRQSLWSCRGCSQLGFFGKRTTSKNHKENASRETSSLKRKREPHSQIVDKEHPKHASGDSKHSWDGMVSPLEHLKQYFCSLEIS